MRKLKDAIKTYEGDNMFSLPSITKPTFNFNDSRDRDRDLGRTSS